MFYHFTVDSLVVAQASSIGKAHSGLVPRLSHMSTLPDFQDEKELPSEWKDLQEHPGCEYICQFIGTWLTLPGSAYQTIHATKNGSGD